MEIFAKTTSNGMVTLEQHSKDVLLELKTNYDKLLYKQVTNFYLNYEEVLKPAALLHDIGKCITQFQDRISKNGKYNHDYEILPHNIIGYCFIKEYTNFPDEVANLILYHHVVSPSLIGSNTKDVLRELEIGDVDVMKQYLHNIGYGDKIKSMDVFEYDGYSIPKFFRNTSINKKTLEQGSDIPDYLFALNLLIVSDRIVSKNYDDDITIEQVINKSSKMRFEDLDFSSFDVSRMEIQQEIAKTTSEAEYRITQVNAPGGYGKTLIAALFSAMSDRKSIIVLPNNTITTSVYITMVDELKKLKCDYTVSCVTANEIKESNFDHTTIFSADITVMNIDSFLSSAVIQSNYEYFNNALNADVIFDEYHDLFSSGDNMLMALYRMLLECRISYSRGRTLLISASPIPFKLLLPSVSKSMIKYLPAENEHYKSLSTCTYNIHFRENMDIKKEFGGITDNMFYITNTIDYSIRIAHELGCLNLMHSFFQKVDRESKLSDLLLRFGKDWVGDKSGYVGTPIMQTSLNISALTVIEDIIGPFETIQRLARCVRFNECPVGYFYINHNTNNVSKLYSPEFSKLWKIHMIKALGGTLYRNNEKFENITLDNVYAIYNSFFSVLNDTSNDKGKIVAREFLSKYADSLNALFEFSLNPRLKKEVSYDDKPIKVNSNVIRKSTSTEQIFFVCEDVNGNLTTPHQISKNSYEVWGDILNESEAPTVYMKNVKRMIEENIFRDLNNTEKKSPNYDKFRKMATCSDRPYFASNYTYSKTYGFFRKNMLK